MGRNARRRHPTVVPQNVPVTRVEHRAYGWNRPRQRVYFIAKSIEELKAMFMPAARSSPKLTEEPSTEA